MRDRDVDQEFLSMMKQRPNVTVNPKPAVARQDVEYFLAAGQNPGRRVRQRSKSQRRQPKQAEAYGIQARNLKRLTDQGARIVTGTDGKHAVGSARAALDIAVNARPMIA